MKLVKEHINEKFTNYESDPIRDLGIGAYSVKMLVGKIKFDSSEFQEYMKQHYIGAKIVSVHTTVYVVEFIGNKTELRKLVRRFMPGYPSDLLNDKIFKVFEKFTEDSDPIEDMGIGVIYQIKKWLKKYNIKNYMINYDLTIDVDGMVHFSKYHNGLLSGNFPEYIQFGKMINGYFSIRGCNLTTLRGCPTSISNGSTNFNGDFSCSDNKLTSLKYAPKEITGNFICNRNKRKFSEEEIIKICKIGGNIQN